MSSALIIVWEHFLFNCERKNKFKVIALRVILFYKTAASKKDMMWLLMVVLLTAKINVYSVLELHILLCSWVGAEGENLK